MLTPNFHGVHWSCQRDSIQYLFNTFLFGYIIILKLYEMIGVIYPYISGVFHWLWDNSHQTNLTNPTVHLSHIPHCTIQNINLCNSVLNDALWDMGQVHCGIVEFVLRSTKPQQSIIKYEPPAWLWRYDLCTCPGSSLGYICYSLLLVHCVMTYRSCIFFSTHVVMHHNHIKPGVIGVDHKTGACLIT